MSLFGGTQPDLRSLTDIEGNEDYSELIARISKAIVIRQLTVPAIIFFETIKPLSFLGNQILIFSNPIVSLIVTAKDYYKFVRMIEDRDNIEKLIKGIEDENAADIQRKQELKKPRRKGSFLNRFRKKGESKMKNEEVDGNGR